MDCKISYGLASKKLAVAVVRRDIDGLRAEVELEQSMIRKPSITV